MSADNYFNVFGFEPKFDIDLRLLAKAYREKQKESHPDRFAHEDVSVQRQAVQETALNNEMFQVLQSHVKRGSYLLSLNGIDFDLNSYTVDDVEMLMNQLRYREQLNDIKENNSQDELFDMQNEIINKQSHITQSLNDLFSQDIVANEFQIKSSLCELQFYEKLAAQVELVEDELFLD